MKPEEFDRLHEAFRKATVNFLRDAAKLNSEGLPFIVRIDDQHGQNLLYAKIVDTPEGLLYLDADDIAVVSPEEDHTKG